MSVLIKGGRIVTATDDSVGDVYIENGTVTQIGESLDVTADKTIDAAGKLVIPGAIDPHTHVEMFFGGTTTMRRLHVRRRSRPRSAAPRLSSTSASRLRG